LGLQVGGDLQGGATERRQQGIRSGLSVPVQLAGGPIGTLDVYAVDPRAWDDTEVRALQASARVVASLLGAAAKASSPAPWPSSSRSRWTPGG
jgi:GAF domain-containing protein